MLTAVCTLYLGSLGFTARAPNFILSKFHVTTGLEKSIKIC